MPDSSPARLGWVFTWVGIVGGCRGGIPRAVDARAHGSPRGELLPRLYIHRMKMGGDLGGRELLIS